MLQISKGQFQWWPEESIIDARQIQTLLWNGNPNLAKFSKNWRNMET